MPFALFAGFILVPVLEIYVVVRVAEVIHVWPTVFLLVAESVFGAWVVKREGRRAWRALRQAIGTGKLPSRQLADAALVLVGGTLLLTPGFLTDIVGFAFVLPATQPIARRILASVLLSRLFAGTRIGRALAAARATKVAPKPRPKPSTPGAATTSPNSATTPDPNAAGTPGAFPAVPPPGPGQAGTPPEPSQQRAVPGEVVED